MMIIDKIIRDKVTVLLEQASYNIILPFYKNLREDEIETKTTSDDFVTTADRQVEIFLTNALIKLIKHSSVIGEEASLIDSDYSSILKNEFVWTIDPIDGTKNYIGGNEAFCSMIALLHFGKVIASWIFIPTSAICYFADKYGVQVRYPDSLYHPVETRKSHIKHIRVYDLSFSASLKYLNSELKEKVKKKLNFIKKRVFIGSAGIEATLLANGKIDFIFYSATSPWDHAPVDIFNRACGGKTGQVNMTDHSSIELDLSKKSPILFVRNLKLWDEIIKFFR